MDRLASVLGRSEAHDFLIGIEELKPSASMGHMGDPQKTDMA